jgi:ubiquinone/menaquinone biosynthesis C-methylase UbiE
MPRTLTYGEAKAFYDRFGARQDSQAFYEDRATDELIAHGAFERARAVFEFGCGTGRFAARLLGEHLPTDCTYRAVDVSGTMVELARKRLAPWASRAEVSQSSGAMTLAAADGTYDRFVSTYVLDLLSDRDVHDLVAEAHRILAPGGLICLTSLTPGRTAFARIVTWVWRRIFALNPKLVGGCRPIRLRDYLPATDWELCHHATACRLGMTSETLVAVRVQA